MNIVILGPQGCGKGTQADMLSAKFDLEHIDMGKFLRKVAEQDTPLGREVWAIQNVTKTLVPKRILEEVFTLKMGSIPREKGIVFDGFPRNLDQAQYFEEALSGFGRKIDKVLIIDIDEDESIARISKRRVCEGCKKGYILSVDVPEDKKCVVCGGQIIQRTDDTEEGIRKRLEVYREETIPVIDYFDKEGLVAKIDGKQSKEEVFEEVLKVIESVK